MKRFGKVWMLCELGILLYIGILLVLRSGIVASPARRIQGIENEGISFEELRIPEGTEVIGIGEATHGNCEFQSIKLEMLKKLVESGKCRSIAFEITAGEGAEINDAIHRASVAVPS